MTRRVNGVSYRSSPAQVTRVACWGFGLLLLGVGGLLISDFVTHRRMSGSPLPFAAVCLAAAGMSARISLSVLTVSDDAVRIVNWFRTYEIPRAPGLTFAFGSEIADAGLFFHNSTHVLLCVGADRSINVAALTLGNTRLGVDRLNQDLDELNARMRTWDAATTTPSEAT